MRKFISKATLESRRLQFKPGTRVELVSMDDPYNTTLKPGDRGTVSDVDEIGTIFVNWDCGSGLGAAYGEDSICKLTKAEVIKEQCKAVAATGRTNMFDAKAAFGIAIEMDFGELANFIFMDTRRYGALILTGELDDADLTEWP